VIEQTIAAMKLPGVLPASIVSAVEADIPALATIADLAFKTDQHTQLKAMHPSKPYYHGEGMQGALKHWLSNPKEKGEVMKAVDPQSGRPIGWVAWGYINLDKPIVDLEAQGDIEKRKSHTIKAVSIGDTSQSHQVKLSNASTSLSTIDTRIKQEEALEELQRLTSSHLMAFQKQIMPPGTRCMIVMSIVIHPDYQGHGVGSALIKYGTRRADAEKVFCWVHSSADGASMFRKNGFQEVDKLEIDLDKWAVPLGVKGSPQEEPHFGNYVFRYLVRDPV
jgi:N-acetylglutamate synthase-like GNAT family acetyltransferase